MLPVGLINSALAGCQGRVGVSGSSERSLLPARAIETDIISYSATRPSRGLTFPGRTPIGSTWGLKGGVAEVRILEKRGYKGFSFFLRDG